MPTDPSGQRRLSRIIRKYELPEYVGLKKAALDSVIANDPDFPKPFHPTDGGRALAWFEDEIVKWQDKRRASREVA